MAEKDVISKRILKILVRDFATYLFGLPVTAVELLDTQYQRVEERRSDLLAKITLPDGNVFLLHIEIQNDNLAIMPVRMLRYLADILHDYPDMPVLQYVIYIGRDKLSMSDSICSSSLDYRYRLVDMHAIDYASLLNQDSPDAWVLAILCDFRDRLPRDIVHTILTRLAEHCGDDLARLRDYIEMLDTLASNRDLNINIREELKMLTINVEKMATYQMGMEKGFEQGMERGWEKGIERGIEKGIEKGVEKGKSELLLRLMTRKFGTLTVQQRQRIEMADEATLLRWADQILFASSPDETMQ